MKIIDRQQKIQCNIILFNSKATYLKIYKIRNIEYKNEPSNVTTKTQINEIKKRVAKQILMTNKKVFSRKQVQSK